MCVSLHFLLSNLLKSNLIMAITKLFALHANAANTLPYVKNISISKVINPTSASVANVNAAVVILPLVTERITKLISKDPRKFTYLPIYLLIYFISRTSSIK